MTDSLVKLRAWLAEYMTEIRIRQSDLDPRKGQVCLSLPRHDQLWGPGQPSVGGEFFPGGEEVGT